MSTYREDIIERYRFPRFRNAMKVSDLQGEVLNELCGDELTLYFMFDEKKEQIKEVTFSGEGCALMTAAADMLCEYLGGKTKKNLLDFSAHDMLSLYGEPPSPSRLKCVLLPYEAVRRAVIGL